MKICYVYTTHTVVLLCSQGFFLGQDRLIVAFELSTGLDCVFKTG